MSTDPALGDYVPEAGKGNAKDSANLPGMGGVYNVVNFNLYHYGSNNPVKYVDPDGRTFSACGVYRFATEGLKGLAEFVAADALIPEPSDALAPGKAVGYAIAGAVLGVAAGVTYHAAKKEASITKVVAESRTNENNKGPYSVKVQFQGPSIKGGSRTSGEGCVEVNIRSDKPIPASEVELAVSAKYSSLSKKEQSALAGSYNKVMNTIETAAKNGGLSPYYNSFQSNTGKPGDRCDFLTTGEINLVP